MSQSRQFFCWKTTDGISCVPVSIALGLAQIDHIKRISTYCWIFLPPHKEVCFLSSPHLDSEDSIFALD
jgi:hypothetical protein